MKEQENEAEVIEKAGGVIVQKNEAGETEIYLVHRPRYDDWSVPKGKMDEGETPVQAALREVAEETGFHCSVERTLPLFYYTTPDGDHVMVHFYEMKVLGEGLTQDGEVDEAGWKTVEEAQVLLSYESLGSYLKEIYPSK